MTAMKEFAVNQLPAPTWRWLKVNDRKVSFPVEGDPSSVEELLSMGNVVNIADADFERINFEMKNGQTLVKRLDVKVSENKESIVVMDFQSEKDAEGYLAAGLSATLEAGANLKLVQVHRLGDGFTLINDVKATVAEGAKMEVIHVVFSGKDTNINTEITLRGDKSAVAINTAYLVEKDHMLDVNYNIPQYGKKTRSDIDIKGVLRDTAKKTLRDTLDFKRGCAGSSGDEVEDVLLMDENIVNKSIPLILCTEEDVEGNHGASIGRIGEDLLFYLESRGMKEEDIYEMMAKARLDAVIKLIPNEDLVTELLNFNGGSEAE